MTITALGSSGAATGTTNSGVTGTSLALDPNEFLKLLVAELQYQDPTKPMDTTELVQQMSSMSQVEQAVQTNARLTSILDQLQVGQAPALLGRTAYSADGSQSGVIQAVHLTSDGIVALLSDGSELLLTQGVILA